MSVAGIKIVPPNDGVRPFDRDAFGRLMWPRQRRVWRWVVLAIVVTIIVLTAIA